MQPIGVLTITRKNQFSRNTMRNDESFEEAIAASRRKWPVFPVHSFEETKRCTCKGQEQCSPGKHPRIKDPFRKASTDLNQLFTWAEKWPGCNWGMPTDRQSGIIVIDVDAHHDGNNSLRAMEKQLGPLPKTVQSLTGNGGSHLFFKQPKQVNVKNSISAVGVGIDVRGDSGFIVLLGNVHRSGRRYVWEREHTPGRVEVAELPGAWLNRILGAAKEHVTEKDGDLQRYTENKDPIASVPLCPSLSFSVTEAISQTIPRNAGQRNRSIFRFAKALRGIPGWENGVGRTCAHLFGSGIPLL
jgi:hypothetical protein